ncbi:MAG: uracil-DNA glycosylase [Elusimicrobia bacterium]|nr:uracil-DNA glycosylase [Candidatus Obscuribacterium magneticum]
MQLDLFETTSKDVLTARTYEEFRQKLKQSNCAKCPALCESRRSIVVDRGNPGAKLVLIGEAPGENEDLQGLAFVGRAGQLLDQIMAGIKLDTNKDMLILNVVKCRPPDNRSPKPEEAANCLPYLEWQLDCVKPKVIVLLGATAAKHLMPGQKDQGMKDRVGQFFDLPEYPGVKFQLLYHPAFILRDPRKKPEMWEHVKALKNHLTQGGIL